MELKQEYLTKVTSPMEIAIEIEDRIFKDGGVYNRGDVRLLSNVYRHVNQSLVAKDKIMRQEINLALSWISAGVSPIHVKAVLKRALVDD